MTFGSRGQLATCICACLYVLIQFVSKPGQRISSSNFTYHIDASGAFTLSTKHVTFRVHGSVFLILVL